MRCLTKPLLSTLAVLVVALSGAAGGCSPKNREAAKAAQPSTVAEAVPTPAEADLAAANQQLVQTAQLMSAVALLELTNAMLPPLMAERAMLPAEAGPAVAQMTLADVLPSPAELVARVAQENTSAGFEAPAPTVVNNYFVQQIVAPEPAVEALVPPQYQPTLVYGGLTVPGPRGNRGQRSAGTANTAPGPSTVLSSASLVARGLPLDSGSLVARSNGALGPNTTGSLPNPTGVQTIGTTANNGPQQRGGRQGGG